MASRRGNGSDLEDILRMNSADLSDAIETDVTRVVDRLHSDGIIDVRTQRDINSLEGVSSYDKASRLVTKLTSSLIAHDNQHQFLLDLCNSLFSVKNDSITSIASRIMQALGYDVNIDGGKRLLKSDQILDASHVDIIKQALSRNFVSKASWMDLGLKLGLHYPTLREFDSNQRGDCDRCMNDVLSAWLAQRDSAFQPTWRSLAKALERIGENVASSQIIREFCK